MEIFRLSRSGCLITLVSVLLAIVATVQSVNYRRPADPFCYGGLGAGFPMSFLCDVTGSSPTTSFGKIDAADWENLNPFAYLVDIVFYTGLFRIVWLSVFGLSHMLRERIAQHR